MRLEDGLSRRKFISLGGFALIAITVLGVVSYEFGQTVNKQAAKKLSNPLTPDEKEALIYFKRSLNEFFIPNPDFVFWKKLADDRYFQTQFSNTRFDVQVLPKGQNYAAPDADKSYQTDFWFSATQTDFGPDISGRFEVKDGEAYHGQLRLYPSEGKFQRPVMDPHTQISLAYYNANIQNDWAVFFGNNSINKMMKHPGAGWSDQYLKTMVGNSYPGFIEVGNGELAEDFANFDNIKARYALHADMGMTVTW